MKVSEEELKHIANLSNLEIKENEIDEYLKNFQDILDFTNTLNEVNVDDLDITIGANEAQNRFRKDEPKVFENVEGLLSNSKDIEQNMFKVPKVV